MAAGALANQIAASCHVIPGCFPLLITRLPFEISSSNCSQTPELLPLLFLYKIIWPCKNRLNQKSLHFSKFRAFTTANNIYEWTWGYLKNRRAPCQPLYCSSLKRDRLQTLIRSLTFAALIKTCCVHHGSGVIHAPIRAIWLADARDRMYTGCKQQLLLIYARHLCMWTRPSWSILGQIFAVFHGFYTPNSIIFAKILCR